MTPRARKLYTQVHPILMRLAQEGGEQVVKKEMRKEASRAYSAFWRGFEKISLLRGLGQRKA